MLGFLGVIGFFGMAFISFSSNYAGKVYNELPLGEVSGIVVDSGGNIYLGLQTYSRVQVYNLEGEFLYAVSLYTGGGSFYLKGGSYVNK